jgi:hypothetical protein
LTYEEFLQEMNASRQHYVHEGVMAKEMNLVCMNLEKLYLRFDEDERKLADQVVAEWARSEDYDLRWDAEFLIGKFYITSASQSLKDLAGRLAIVPVPSAPVKAELEKIQRLLAEFGSPVP